MSRREDHISTKIKNTDHWKQNKKNFTYFIAEIRDFLYMRFSENAQCFVRALLWLVSFKKTFQIITSQIKPKIL